MAAGETLILEARNFKDPQHWRWVLKDSQGKFLADQEVDLDPTDPNHSAFINLEGFLKANSSPDRWLEDQIRLMQQVGSWMGREALASGSPGSALPSPFGPRCPWGPAGCSTGPGKWPLWAASLWLSAM